MKNCIYSLLLFFSVSAFAQSDTNNLLKTTDATDQLLIPVYVPANGDNEAGDEQESAGLLQASRDVFSQFAGFQFSAAGYRTRGHEMAMHTYLFSDAPAKNPETGGSGWQGLSGLNELTRNSENATGITTSRSNYSGMGNYTNIDSKVSSFKKGLRFSYSNGNRNFRHRLMLTLASGTTKKGWSLIVSASARQGANLYRKGTYYNAAALYIGIEKKIDDKHLLNFLAFYAPSEQAGFAAEVLETYELTNNNYYNSLWGLQDGKQRNSTVTRRQRPALMLMEDYQIDANSKFRASAVFTFGKSSTTGLNWCDAKDPRPDYYSKLPGYYYDKGDSIKGNTIAAEWPNEINSSQIDWDRLVAINLGNLYTLPSEAGQAINTTETRARYIVENRIEDLRQLAVNAIYNMRFRHLFISAGVNAFCYQNKKYKSITDLLGASFWLDYDMFAAGLGSDPLLKQNNINAPDKKLTKGDVFGYAYTINMLQAETWSQVEFSRRHLDFFVAGSVSTNKTWRMGLMANGKFPGSSKGKSQSVDFLNGALKTGAVYKFNGRQYLTVNLAWQSQAPLVNNYFISVSSRNQVTEGLCNEKVLASDLNYLLKYAGLKLRATAYFTQISGRIWQRSYYSDVYNTNVNLIMKNIGEQHQGIELGFEKSFAECHTLLGAIGAGQFFYSTRPKLEAWQDNNGMALFSNRTVYLKNFRLGTGPQTVVGLAYKYTKPGKWFAAIYGNYFDDIFVAANPDRRTEEALSNYFSGETQLVTKMVTQEKLPAYFLINAQGGRFFKIRKKYQLNLNLSLNNILNNRHILLSGREQLRWEISDPDKFKNKYTYMTGISYLLIANFSF